MIRVKFNIMLLSIMFLVLCNIAFSQSEIFPVGTGWVKNPNGVEREDMYRQAAECGINVINGNVQLWDRQAVLDSAEKYGIQIVADKVAYNINKYRGYDDYYCNHRTFESTGYNSYTQYPRLQQIEIPILYDFEHQVGNDVSDVYAEEDVKGEKKSMRVNAPGSPGYLMWNFNANPLINSSTRYYTKFRLKIDGDIGSHDPVADIRVIRKSDGFVFRERTIYSDDFSDVGNLTYKEFELDCGTFGKWENIDFRVYWHGQVTLYVDNVKLMDTNGKTLFSGSKDNSIISEVQSLHSYDSNHNTLIGYYQDEPCPLEIEPIHYLSKLMYEGAPADNKNVVMQPCTNKNYTYHQYLNMGSPETYQSRYLLRNIFPINGWSPDAPEPGESGYNDYIQDRWETYLIPLLDDARYVANLNDVPFWYWAQSTSWWSSYRSPLPKEIRAMVSLGLAYNAKGIWYFLYTSIDDDSCVGLVSRDFIPNDKWYEVQAINNDLQSMTPDILHLNWESAFTSGDAVPDGSYVLSISGADYVEIANFHHESNGEKYFMLVNRRTENSQTMTVQLTSSQETRLIEDVLASRQPWYGDGNRVAYRVLESGENTFVVKLEPGEGRLFRISDGLKGSITKDAYWSGQVITSDNLVLNNGSTLTINPGVNVKVATGKKIIVNGTLIAQGTSANHIVFTSNSSTPSAGDWYGIRFEDSSNDANCILKYCDIKYAQYGVYCNRANPKIENNTLTNNNYGIYTYFSSPDIKTNSITNNYTGIYGTNSSPYVYDNKISNNGTSGVEFWTLSQPVFYNNSFKDNGLIGTAFKYFCYPKFGPTSGSDKGFNVVADNDVYGVYNYYYTDPFMGSTDAYNQRIGGYNSIANNSGYNLYAYDNCVAYAYWNWWGLGVQPITTFYNYQSWIFYTPYLQNDPGGGSTLGKIVTVQSTLSDKNRDYEAAGFDPKKPNPNRLSDLWLWGHDLFIRDCYEKN
ncbi:MAG: right-handed parallel beta-helix repeat-containing protein [archaeon]